MKRGVAVIGLGISLVLAGAGCGASAPAAGHGILFVGKAEHGKSRIFLWRPGSEVKPLGPAGYGISGPSWSPDGRSIAFSELVGHPAGAHPTPNDIYLMRSDGTDVKRPTSDSRQPNPEGDGPPSWSPDGRQIVYVRYLNASPWNDFVIADVHSGHERTLRGYGPSSPKWGKAGIAYTPHSGIMLLDPATGRARLAARGSFAYPPASSRSGVLAEQEPTRILLLMPSGRLRGKLPIPRAIRPLCGVIAWSPNGKQILAWTAGANAGLWVGTVSTKRWRRLPAPIAAAGRSECSVSWR